MRHFSYLSILIALLLFATCKRDDDNNGSGKVNLLTATTLLDQANKKLFELGQQNTSTPQQALMLTADWLRSQPNVADVYVWDSINMKIVTDDGLATYLSIVLTDDDGYSIFRGGGGAGQLDMFKAASTSGSCTNKMQSDKVLLYVPAESEFYKPNELATLAASMSNSDKHLQVTTLTNAACTPEKTKEFKDYGLVIIDTHGNPDGFLCGLTYTFTRANKPKTLEALEENITTAMGADRLTMLKNGQLSCASLVKVQASDITWYLNTTSATTTYQMYIQSKYIKTLPEMPNTILLGNMCYSGYSLAKPSDGVTDPIQPAFVGLNPITYYCYTQADGYSRAVTDWFAKRMENQIVTRLVINGDSTGIAHLKADNVTENEDTLYRSWWTHLYFKQYKNKTYCYGCGGKITDSRDGRQYNTVCIGSQVWMAEDLKYDLAGASYCFNDVPANCDTFGKMYRWPDVLAGASPSSASPSGVRGVCPNGWHIPSRAEWNTLFAAVGAINNAGYNLKDTSSLWRSPNNVGTNPYGFSAKPGGARGSGSGGGYSAPNIAVSYFTATDSSGSPYKVTLTYQRAEVQMYVDTFKQIVNCRCVKD